MSMADPAAVYGCNIQRSGSSGSYTYSVAPDWAHRPVNYVSFWDAARFVNWLQNGQPTGPQNAMTTEDGAYTLNGYTGSDGSAITRNPGIKWCLPSDDEWFKAAYYKGGGTNAGYWTFPTQSDTIPVGELPPGHTEPPGSANYEMGPGPLDPIYHTTEVGAYAGSASHYETFDQGGNVEEWVESVYSGTHRGFRGGDWGSGGGNLYPDSSLEAIWPDREWYLCGLRVVYLGPIPEQRPPVISLSPRSQTAEIGSTVRFRVSADGYPPLAYEWFFNGTTVLGGATNSVLRMADVGSSQSGAYTVVVTNIAGAVTSTPAMLSVIPPVERKTVPALTLMGQPGSALNLENVEALNPSPNWTTLGNVSLTSTSQWYFDLSAPLPPQRFYRAWQPGPFQRASSPGPPPGAGTYPDRCSRKHCARGLHQPARPDRRLGNAGHRDAEQHLATLLRRLCHRPTAAALAAHASAVAENAPLHPYEH